MDEDRVRELAAGYALQNAVRHESDAEVGAVVGKLMGEHEELREHGDAVPGVVAPVVDEINALSGEERRARLEADHPALLEELEADDGEEDEGLPPLPSVEEGDDVVMRFAPNPNGPPTIGSARGMVVNDAYVERYGGELILRFDDTDPVNKPPLDEAYGWYEEDAGWLGMDVARVERASARLETYYEHARRLVEEGAAYVCHCPQRDFKQLKDAGEPCPHRDRPAEESLAELDAMIAGDHDEGDAVLRIATDIAHKNPAIRDWVALRVVDVATHPHPRVGSEYHAWPMLDFQGAIDDHLMGTTHIIRGKDLRDSEERQGYLYDALGWEYPEVLHWGRISIEEYGTLSTSSLAEAIADGDYEGWDDPAVPTVRALRRRGIHADAIRAAMEDLGVSESDVDLSMEHVYSENRKLVDDAADRYFLVRDPVELQIEDAEPTTATPPRHPDDESRGVRELAVDDAILVERDDVPDVGDGVRLKSLYNVEIVDDDPLVARRTGDDLAPVREGPMDVVHWLPADSPDATLKTPEGDVAGVVEEGALGAIDDVVQFERVGFARVESAEPFVAVYGHR